MKKNLLLFSLLVVAMQSHAASILSQALMKGAKRGALGGGLLEDL